jgi:hypothetical protein
MKKTLAYLYYGVKYIVGGIKNVLLTFIYIFTCVFLCCLLYTIFYPFTVDHILTVIGLFTCFAGFTYVISFIIKYWEKWGEISKETLSKKKKK